MTALRYQRSQRWFLCIVAVILLIVQARYTGSVFAGAFPDNDDMLRLQQVRDLLAGQDWFNVDQTRFLTPEGGNIHWSRLPDLLIGGLILLARPVLGQSGAEMFALVAYPLILLAWSMAMITQVARRLGANVIGQAAAITLFVMSAAAYNFWPGRIDHHNLVVAFILTGLVSALSPKQSAQSAVIAAFCAVAALSIAIESLPFVGAIIVSFGLFWIIRGHREGVRLAMFGVALAVFAIAFYALDAPGISTRRAVCDAYGQSHFAGLVSGGCLLGLLGIFGGYFETWAKRLSVGLVAGCLTLLVIIAVNPACLGGPYAGVSEQVRVGWLSVVSEARTFSALWQAEPSRALWQFGFILAGLIAAILVIWRAQAHHLLPRIVVSVFLILSALITVWQIRGVTFSHVFAAIMGGVLIGRLFEHWREQGGAALLVILATAVLALTPKSWQALAQNVFPVRAEYALADRSSSNTNCRAPEAYFDFDHLPSVRILTPIDLGMPLLVRSNHSVFGGPYHRNLLGIERVTKAYMSATEDARMQINAMGATHVLYCAGLNETARYARLEPESFAAQMEQGILPDWLEPVDSKDGFDGVVRLYRVKPL